MKTTYLILFTFITSLSFSQDFDKLFYGPDKDKVFGGLIEIENGVFIVSHNTYSGPYITDTILENNSSLVKYDTNNKELIQRKLLNYGDLCYTNFIHFDPTNNTIISQTSFYKNNIHFYNISEYDLNLNLIKESVFQSDIRFLSSFTSNNNDNLVIIGNSVSPTSNMVEVIECNADIGLVSTYSLSSSNLYVPTTFAFNNDKYYVYSLNQNWMVYDNNFNIDTSFIGLKSIGASQKSYVLNGVVYANGISAFDKKEVIFTVNTNNIQDTIFNSSYRNYANNAQRGYWAIDGNTEGNIFFSNTIGGCSPYVYSTVCKNYMSIHKIDTSGNLLWEKYIGGDSASYLVFHVKATLDGGCIVIFDRFDFETPYGNEDVYYIKYDANGIADTSYFSNLSIITGINKIPKEQSFLIFPNPIKDKINIISSNYKNKNILVYNAVGKLVFKEDLKETIDISALTIGNYLYNIVSENGQRLQEGKLLKE